MGSFGVVLGSDGVVLANLVGVDYRELALSVLTLRRPWKVLI